MTVKVGDKLPHATFVSMVDGDIKTITTEELTAGKKVLIFALPGAFTPTCSKEHLPGFVAKEAEIKAKGISTVACLSVNDVFVMEAWAAGLHAKEKVLMLSDNDAAFSKAMGLTLDLGFIGGGTRSQRYAVLVDDGVIKVLNVEPSDGLTCSSAHSMLDAIV